jgi:uncharacterized GH25 family protein
MIRRRFSLNPREVHVTTWKLLYALALCLALAGNAVAHDTFIMPEKFQVAPQSAVKIGFHSADSFPESSSLPKRLREVFLHAGSAPVPITVSEDGKRLVGTVTAPASGYMIVTAINAAATENMKAPDFLDYIKEEGLTHVIEARSQSGEADKPARERYTMFAKTIFVSGAPNDGYKRAVGLPIEIVPEKDPASLKAGESLPVRVLFRGAPAKGLDVMAASTAPGSAKNRSIGKTDANGHISVPVVSGQWRLHTIHMERSSTPDADWESFWATLTFEVR